MVRNKDKFKRRYEKMRYKMLFVQSGKIQEIPTVKKEGHAIVDKKLANTTGLLTTIIYETKNRRPYKIVRIDFERISFNENGIYSYSEQILSENFRIKLNYAIGGYDDLRTLPVPIAPELPNKNELALMKRYINDKYSILLENDPFVFESTMKKLTTQHMNDIQQMKKSHR